MFDLETQALVAALQGPSFLSIRLWLCPWQLCKMGEVTGRGLV